MKEIDIASNRISCNTQSSYARVHSKRRAVYVYDADTVYEK